MSMSLQHCGICGGDTSFLTHTEHLCISCGDKLQTNWKECGDMIAQQLKNMRDRIKVLEQEIEHEKGVRNEAR